MRQIIGKAEQGKKRKRNQIIVGLILVGVMILSTLGYAFNDNSSENSKKIVYNGFKFENQQGLWVLNTGGIDFGFQYNPNEVERVNGVINPLNNYTGKPLYISCSNRNAEFEIYQNLDRFILRKQYACLVNSTCGDENLPIKTCEDNFILIEESEDNSSSIIQEQNCVFIKGNKEELVKITDEFLFKIIGVD